MAGRRKDPWPVNLTEPPRMTADGKLMLVGVLTSPTDPDNPSNGRPVHILIPEAGARNLIRDIANVVQKYRDQADRPKEDPPSGHPAYYAPDREPDAS